MKKFKSIVAVVLVIAMLFSLTACGNKLPAVQKAFEKEGYKLDESSITAAIFNSIIEAATKATQEEGKEPTVKTYVFKKDFLNVGLVLEFKNSKEMKEFYENSSNTIKGFVKDMSESDLMNGNCMLVSLSKDMYEIFKKA